MTDADDDIDPGIHCRVCEAVCCRLPVLLIPADRVPAWLTWEDEYGLAQMAQGDDGWCIALDRDTLMCTIYQSRPDACRDYAMGGTLCQQERAEAGQTRRVPIAIKVLNGDG